LPNCQINAKGVEQIAQILTTVDCLRDLNLDNNPNEEENYYLLCKPVAKYVTRAPNSKRDFIEPVCVRQSALLVAEEV